MLRRILTILLVLLVALAVAGRSRDAWRAARARSLGDSLARGARAPASAGADRKGRGPQDQVAIQAPPLDSSTRLLIRSRLGAELERHYLDSLLSGPDSVVRHWPAADRFLQYAVVPGGAPDFIPDMVHDVSWALDTWSPAGVGLRTLEVRDTGEASLIVRWVDTLDGDRAGFTDLTWDRAGRIRRAEVYLATRTPGSDHPLSLESRRAIALHEIGHALGLPHSANRADAMFPIAAVTAPSERDRFSLRLLYALPMGWVGNGLQPDRRTGGKP